VHPLAQADRLLRLPAGEFIDALLAQGYKLVDALELVALHQVLDIAFRFELEFFLDLDLDPQPLAIEAVLVAQLMAGHREVALVSVLVGSTPGMMNTHRIVGGDGTVQEGPLGLALISLAEFVKSVGALPKFQNSPLLSREIDLRFDLLEGHVGSLELGCQKLYLIKDE